MKNLIIFFHITIVALFLSCNSSSLEEASAPLPVVQRQVQGFPESNPEFDLETIENRFTGVYLPIEYINSLKHTRNHSLSMHSNNDVGGIRYHDVLAVFENRIFSNLRFHDRYAIRASEGNLFQFVPDGKETIIIIDNNGHLYEKIGNDPTDYHTTVSAFVANLILYDLTNRQTGISINNGVIHIPYLKDITGEDTFFVILNDTFFEKGLNMILASGNPNNLFTLALVIDGSTYYFYYVEPSSYFGGSYPERSGHILYFHVEH
ncbi:MAG: hypothetical protein FWC64_07735 [Treponema sp.]|nr:hypothetical protein [Treponema sp.]